MRKIFSLILSAAIAISVLPVCVSANGAALRYEAEDYAAASDTSTGQTAVRINVNPATFIVDCAEPGTYKLTMSLWDKFADKRTVTVQLNSGDTASYTYNSAYQKYMDYSVYVELAEGSNSIKVGCTNYNVLLDYIELTSAISTNLAENKNALINSPYTVIASVEDRTDEPITMTVAVDAEEPVALTESEGSYSGDIIITAMGEHTLTFTAAYEGDTEKIVTLKQKINVTDFLLKDPQIISDAGTVTGTVTVLSYPGENKDVTLVIAAYSSENELLGFQSAKTVITDETTLQLSTEVLTVPEGAEVEFMIWDSFTSLASLSSVIK